MKTYLTIKNYRCFVRPVTIEVIKGFTAFVGMNNAGKSTIMRFLLEFRPFLNSISNPNVIGHMLTASPANLMLQHVLDDLEVFSNRNNNDIEFSIKFAYEDGDTKRLGDQGEEEYLFVIKRDKR